MTKIYIVTSGEDESYNIESVFSTIELADRYVKQRDTDEYSDFDIEEWTIDGEAKDQEVYLVWYAYAESMNPSIYCRVQGAMSTMANDRPIVGDPLDPLQMEDQWPATYALRSRGKSEFLFNGIVAENPDRAKAIASFRMGQILSGNVPIRLYQEPRKFLGWVTAALSPDALVFTEIDTRTNGTESVSNQTLEPDAAASMLDV